MAMNLSEYTCPCGYKTEWLYHALVHVDETGHTMSVYGVLRPGVRKAICPPLYNSTPKPVQALYLTPTPATTPMQTDTARFDELRQKLAKTKGG